MKGNFSLHIKQPCSEKFDTFQATQLGGFCNSCQKEVIDFTKMSEREIIQYFKNEKKNTCGYFRQSQLKVYTVIDSSPKKQRHHLLKASLISLSLLSLLPTSKTQAQEKPSSSTIAKSQKEKSRSEISNNKTSQEGFIVEGIVIDEYNNPLISATVALKGTNIGVATDLDGRFKFPQALKPNDILIFNFIGYQSKEYVVPQNPPKDLIINIEVKIKLYDFVCMGEVEVAEVYKSKPSLWQRIKRIFK